MPADEHISRAQVLHVFHGTQNWNADTHPQGSYERPFHVALDTDLPGDYAFQHGAGGGTPEEDWERMQ